MKYSNVEIDGYNASERYGVVIEQDGLAQIIQVPSFKKVDTTEWDEYDGVEADLISPVLDAKTATITFYIYDLTKAQYLYQQLKSEKKSFHTFSFLDLNREYDLRLTSNGSFSSMVKLGKMTLTFAFKNVGVDEASPYQIDKTEVWQRGYKIDYIDFSQFGIWVLDGSDDNIRKFPAIRENLKIDCENEQGIEYDDWTVHNKTKDVTLNCLIDTDGIDAFWKRYNSLFFMLIQPNYRKFEYNGDANLCYYKSMSVSKFRKLRNGKIWCQFSITLTFTYDTENKDKGGSTTSQEE